MKLKKHTQSIFVATLLIGSGVLAEQQGWLDRLLPKKTDPQFLSDSPSKPLVEPHPDVVNLQNSFAEVAAAVKPAVVNISAVHIQKVQGEDPYEFFFGDPNEFFYRYFGEEAPPQRPQRKPQEYRQEGTGSGVLIDPAGYILTNNHVVQGADELTVTLSDGKTLKGAVVGTDPRTDLAVIRIKGSEPFAFVPLGDSSAIRIGDWVLAIGSPFGLEQTVTAGIISAIRQSLNIEGRTFSNLIQTDAAINRGNSGGPLVNIRGELVGINTAIYAPTGVFSGIGFAIPVNDAKMILKELIEKGHVERSWMGVDIAKVDEIIARQFGLKSAEGALINNVMPESPAAKAGLKRGDVIVEVNGKKIKNVNEVQDVVSRTKPKTVITVKIIRDGESQVVKLTTELMPSQEGEPTKKESSKKSTSSVNFKWLGAEFLTLNDQTRHHYGIQDSGLKGVVISGLPANSAAAEAGLEEGDVIRSINRIKVEDVEDLKEASKKVDAKKGLVFDVVREGRSFYLSFQTLQ